MIKQNKLEFEALILEKKIRKLVKKSKTFLVAFTKECLDKQSFTTFSYDLGGEEKQLTFFDTKFLLPPASKIEKGNGYYTAIYNMKDL